MATILIIEDDDTIAFGIKSFLLKNNYNVIHGENLKKGKDLFTKDIDLILLDLNLPDGSGFDFCHYIKKIKDVPIIFLTVVDEESTMIKGLDMGGDDYITKPFKLSLLQARITAVLRRTLKQNNEESVLYCKNIKVIKSESRVYKNNHEIELTVGEYNLLLQLLENKNRTLTRTTLLKNLWDYNGEFVNNNTLSVAIKRLREKLEDDSCIKTVRGLGYRMED
ncbi:response regulator transcription factor [Clostridium sporogenes]|uniref:Stage 0 sporulation protein A homolog n=1 Tax=Clostridium botulinum TaxID=1491 RepID=A0A6M0SV67_CLOBO|nr:response regulator transcription factor [Clostridium sporogenes]NFA59427.1 response regulator transcription factor [Clostridium botulinum]NFI74611.1 response regulator transcription factor [Clostridium sporogenes]NFL71254.1 response regulator transcription factor [Clostridium sporogenes]NFM25745.1 response regulator transcription factor [Clostridium sporogenes]NFP62527.1 response regulator transcription factor [Clostridium sporogenes]